MKSSPQGDMIVAQEVSPGLSCNTDESDRTAHGVGIVGEESSPKGLGFIHDARPARSLP